MEKITVKEVLKATGGRLVSGRMETEFANVSIDTRTIRPGSLFIPIVGEKRNGHEFIGDAVKKGARGFLFSDRKFEKAVAEGAPVAIRVKDTLKAMQDIADDYRKRFRIKMIAVTGSNGKTTTKELIAEIISTKYRTVRSYKNFNNDLGIPLNIFRLDRETEAGVFELGMNARGEIKRLSQLILPDTGVITNIGLAHLEKLRSVENIARAKAELLETLHERLGVAVLNHDDPNIRKIARKFGGKKIWYSTLTPGCNIRACNIELRPDGKPEFDLYIEEKKRGRLKLGLIGIHSVSNVLAAIGAGVTYGISWENIKTAVENFTGLEQRLQIFPARNYRIINDTYNSNPSSLKASLEVLTALEGRKKIAVLGDMLELGSKSKQYHREAGKFIAAAGVDYLLGFGWFTQYLIEAARDSGMKRNRAIFYRRKGDLLKKLASIIDKEDIILIKGSRKMKMEDIVARLMKHQISSTE